MMRFMRPLPAQDELLALFSYDPELGLLSWRVRRGPRPAWICAGYEGNGYIVVEISGAGYLVHRIIWKMMTGEDPAGFIDHADGDTMNNCWSNLRCATPAQNSSNVRLNRRNTSGVAGVSWDRGSKKWRAIVGADGRRIDLGRFERLDDAARAVTAARRRLHGTFTRTH
jgi:hypothetical protein